MYSEGTKDENYRFVSPCGGYLEVQGQAGYWGSDLERVAVAKLNRCCVDVYSIDGDYSIWPDKKKEHYHVSPVLWKNHAEATEPVMKCGGWTVKREKARLMCTHPD